MYDLMGGAHSHGRSSGASRKHPTPAYTTFPDRTASAAAAFSCDPSNAVRTEMSSLPYAYVDSSLRALAGKAEGFGRLAVGGLHGPLYHVTSLEDDGPGSLRDGCRRKEPLWIVFEVSGTIHLSSYLNVSSYKTIDGRGQRIKLTGKGLRLKECEHVIICNLEFEGGRGHDVDGIQIKPNSKHIWIDRCSLRDFDDGLIDITRASTDITISRCHFSQHDKTMLIGADPSHSDDRCIRVTIHHCFFDGTRQRHPRVRYGKVHLYNNYTRNWGIYAVCASVESQIYSQCNIYEAGHKKVAFKYLTEKIRDVLGSDVCISAASFGFPECPWKHVYPPMVDARGVPPIIHLSEGDMAADKEEARTGFIRSEGDLFINGTQAGLMTVASEMFHPREYYPAWTIEAPSDALKHVLHHCTGWQHVPRPADDTAIAY